MTTTPQARSESTHGERALLEAAAKAAGIRFDAEESKPHPKSGAFWGLWLVYDREPTEYDRRYWNPLTNSGQALELAAQLRLKVIPGKHKGDGCTVESQRLGIAGCTAFRDDPAEQMRIAIVHVAAEIGAAMAPSEGRVG